jgi:hypothetical protein
VVPPAPIRSLRRDGLLARLILSGTSGIQGLKDFSMWFIALLTVPIGYLMTWIGPKGPV